MERGGGESAYFVLNAPPYCRTCRLFRGRPCLSPPPPFSSLAPPPPGGGRLAHWPAEEKRSGGGGEMNGKEGGGGGGDEMPLSFKPVFARSSKVIELHRGDLLKVL